jgi:hypothetical protein
MRLMGAPGPGRLLIVLSLLVCCCNQGSHALPNVGKWVGNAGRFVLRKGPPRREEIVTEDPPPPRRRTVMGHLVEGLKNGAASGMASASVKCLLHPFDVVKTMQQHSAEDLNVIQVWSEREHSARRDPAA